MTKNKDIQTITISSKNSIFSLGLSELWRYRDLIMLFVKRDFISLYKQTILGPLWYILQPLFTILIFTIVFGGIAQIPTDGIPALLFYMSGLTAWNYFAECLNKTSGTFINNANIFGKVYFPRLTVPISIIISNLISFGIQLVFFISMIFIFHIRGYSIHIHASVLVLPLLILTLAMLGLGLGIIVSALTTKYRDLKFLFTFGVQLMMYATPVIYPTSVIPERFKQILILNPMSSLIETFRSVFIGSGEILWSQLTYSFVFALISLIIGLLIFHKTEKNFMDTV